MTQPPPSKNQERLSSVAFYLYLVAGALALGAAALEYLRDHRFASTPLFAGVFMIAMAFATRRRNRGGTPPGGI